MYRVFNIPQDRISAIVDRITLRSYKTVGVTVIVFIGLQLSSHRKISTLVVPVCIMVVIFVIITILNKKKIRKAYESLEIVLDEDGIEWKSPMLRYKRILFTDAVMEVKPDNSAIIYDSNYSLLQRRFYGQGSITIPAEVQDINLLLAAVNQQIPKKNQNLI